MQSLIWKCLEWKKSGDILLLIPSIMVCQAVKPPVLTSLSDASVNYSDRCFQMVKHWEDLFWQVTWGLTLSFIIVYDTFNVRRWRVLKSPNTKAGCSNIFYSKWRQEKEWTLKGCWKSPWNPALPSTVYLIVTVQWKERILLDNVQMGTGTVEVEHTVLLFSECLLCELNDYLKYRCT